MENKKFKWLRKELFWSFVLPIVFLLISIGLRFYFIDYAYPVDYEVYDSYDWANIFTVAYAWSTGWCILFHVQIAVMGMWKNINTRGAWVFYAVLAFLYSLVPPIYISIFYREESLCTLWMFLAFILKYVVTFIVSTRNAPKHWDFCPF